MTIEGTRVRLDGVELDYVYQERRPKDVPIYIGATGMQMMELAGEIADGVVLNYLVDPAYNVQAMEALDPRRGQGRAHASTTSTARSSSCAASTRDRQAALDAARLMVTQYLGQQPHIMKASGVPQELLDEIATVLTWPATHEQVAAASRLVPDDVVQRCTASGSAGRGRRQGRRVRRQRLHLPDPVPPRSRRRVDDRDVRPPPLNPSHAASERQRASGHTRPAWPGNAMAVR